MKYFLFLLAGICGNALGHGKDPMYPVKDIPQELLEDANAVIRLSEKSFTIIDTDKAVYREHVVITILNKKGDHHASMIQYYDSQSKVTEFGAYVYGNNGEEIFKLKKSDIQDYSAIAGYTLYADDRVQYADLSQVKYPYTVDYTIETNNSQLLGIPNFYVITNSHTSVEKSVYVLNTPKNLTPRFREVNFSEHRKEKNTDKGIQYTWNFEKIKPVENEVFSNGILSVAPWVEISPDKFEYDGFAGEMNSWNNLALWIDGLIKDRDKLPPATVAKVKQLTEGQSKEEKIATIYAYLQKKTRYVNISLGIGGLQPFEASVVDAEGYGDCKALSNYTKALLKAVGIESYYTLVYAGDEKKPLDPEYPANRFNHVILCVPNEQDSIWLECTSQTNPFGYMGTFTGNRDVLLITDTGGKIVHTPTYGLKDNVQNRNIHVTFDREGRAEAKVNTSYRGLQYENDGLNFYLTRGEKEQKDWVHRNTDIPNYQLVDFNFENHKKKIPEAVLTMTLVLPNYASASGKRFYFEPNMMNKVDIHLPTYKERKSKVYLADSYKDVDTVEYEFPSDYQSEYLPEPATIQSEFGTYTNSFNFIQGKLIYTRELTMQAGEYPPEKYSELQDFLRAVAKEDNKKVVFITKT